MKYLFIQCFWLVNIYLNKYTLSSIIDYKSPNPEIDDFIRRLLTSQKFDELADKIAEKAVDKIIEFEQGSQGPEIKLKSNLSAKNNSNIQEIQVRHRDKPVKQREESSGENKIPSNKIGKINMQAFMKKDASLKSENLSLKYKYLTQKANKKDIRNHKEKTHQQTDTGSMVLRNNDNLDKKSEKYIEHEEELLEPEDIDNRSQAYEEVPETSHENSRDKSFIAEKEREEDNMENYYDQIVITNIYHKDGQSDKKEDEDQQYYDASKEQHEDDAKNTIPFSDVRQEKQNITVQTENDENKTTTKMNEIKEKEVATEEHGDDLSESLEDSDDNKVNPHGSTKNKTLNRVRTVGEKNFVFQSSAEYSDYLQEYDKVRNDHPEKDFL